MPALFAVYPGPLAKAAAFGLLAAAAFSLVPLARARATPPLGLFRTRPGRPAEFGPEMVGAVLAAVGLVGAGRGHRPDPAGGGGHDRRRWRSASACCGCSAAARRRGAARCGADFARRRLRIGLANLAGPASAARTAAPAIGLGVALLAAVVLIQSSLLAQIREVAPSTAPALVFTEIPAEQRRRVRRRRRRAPSGR